MRVGRHPGDISRRTDFGKIVQLAYHAPDIAEAAHWFTSKFYAGPFFLFEHIALSRCAYRGAPSAFDHSSAYGQLDDVMIELIHQNDDASSAVRDMYAADEEGIHHAAIFVDNIDASLRRAKSKGFVCTLDATTSDGVRFVMVDARDAYGFMLEFYERTPALVNFYEFIRRKARDWDGEDCLRRL